MKCGRCGKKMEKERYPRDPDGEEPVVSKYPQFVCPQCRNRENDESLPSLEIGHMGGGR
jgi:DNA-directed RNA polymerase subunit RPC12/RpoP